MLSRGRTRGATPGGSGEARRTALCKCRRSRCCAMSRGPRSPRTSPRPLFAMWRAKYPRGKRRDPSLRANQPLRRETPKHFVDLARELLLLNIELQCHELFKLGLSRTRCERVPEECRSAVQLVYAVGLQVHEHDLVVDPLGEDVRVAANPRARH